MLSNTDYEKVCALTEKQQINLITYSLEGCSSRQALDQIQDELKTAHSQENIEDIIGIFAQLSLMYKQNQNRFHENIEGLSCKNKLHALYNSNCLDKQLELYPLYKYIWRVDISIPKANAIIININRDNGEKVSFRLDITTFHKFRFSVAMILKELNNIKKNSGRIKAN